MTKRLHITNGHSLTNYLQELGFEDQILTWQEMLCEGPTIPHIDLEEFLSIRIQFLKDCYHIDVDKDDLLGELKKLDNANSFDEIVLWFEYDLFCHINMIGVINLLHQKEISTKLSLVCSGRVDGEKELKGLGELSPGQLMKHYRSRVILSHDDIKLAIALWRTYCGKDHNIFKPYITKPSSFTYMGNCLKAHLTRFPDQKTGLNSLEKNILIIIRDQDIKSTHHLLGYILNYQGYYGFGDTQLERLILNLKPLYELTEDGLQLNRLGHEALLGQKNVTNFIKNDMSYGGVNRLDFYFNTRENKLIKSLTNHVH